MFQLIKQVLKSFKGSMLLIFALIFITFCIILSSFSLLYLNTNITNSIDNVNKYGNSSNVTIEQNYGLPKPEYTLPSEAEINTPKSKEILVSKYQYGENNVIFPYEPKDFTSTNLNVDRWSRKPGILKSTGVSIDKEGKYVPLDINISDPKQWHGIGYKMGTYFNPSNLLFSYDENQKPFLSGYFNTETGKVDEYFTILQGNYVANNTMFNKYDTSSAIPATTIPHTLFTNSVTQLPTSSTNLNITDVTYYADLYNALLGNTMKKGENVYTLTLNMDSLSPAEKNIIESLPEQQKNSLLNVEVVIKGDWVQSKIIKKEGKNDGTQNPGGENGPPTTKEGLVKLWLQNIAEQKSDQLSEFLQAAVSNSADSFLKQKNILTQFESSYTIIDNDSSFKYLVSNKEDSEINKIVYSSGSRLVDSDTYLKIADEATMPFYSSDNKPYLKNLLMLLLSSTAEAGFEVKPYIKEYIVDILKDLEAGRPIDNSKYRVIFAIYQPDIDLSKFVSTNKQKIDLRFSFEDGVAIADTAIDVILSVYTPYGFATVVPDKFLDVNNKEYIPVNQWNNLITRWNELLNSWDNFFSLTDEEINSKIKNFSNYVKELLSTLDSKYTVTINTQKYVIIGTGISPDLLYPSTSLENLIINPRTEFVLFTNQQGYNSILSTSPATFQNKYFSGITKERVADGYINELNKEYKNNFNKDYSGDLVYKTNDFSNNKNILTFRIYLPDSIVLYVSIVAIAVIVVLIVLGLYLSYLLLRSYISKNLVQLAIVKANGFSTLKIAMALSLFGLIVALLAGFGGYIGALFLQGTFYSAISPFWYVPLDFLKFSIIGFFGGTLSVFVVFLIFTWVILKATFKKPINLLISSNVETKVSKVLTMIKNSSQGIQPLFKFRLNLSFSNFYRFIFYTMLCSFGLSFVTSGISLPQKFDQSTTLTKVNKNYTYSFDLVTPTEQSGLYKMQKYSNLGFTDVDNGIYPLYPGTIMHNGKQEKFYQTRGYDTPYKLEDLKVLNKDGTQKMENGEPIYFGNILLPSYQANFAVKNDIFFGESAVFAKWLLDFEINFGFQINPWEFVKAFLPPEIIARSESQSQIFLKDVYEAAQNPENTKLSELQKKNNFILYDKDTKLYSVNPKTVININLDYTKIKFTDDFLAFIGCVYGDEELSNKDVKISYGIIPYEDKESTETYSYINANTILRNKEENINIVGIKNDSSFVTLKDQKERDISDLLTTSKYEYPIIINNGAAYHYKLKVGDKIKINVNNSYFRFSRKVLDSQGIQTQPSPDGYGNSEYTLTVAGIASTSFGEEFYISQDNANKILGLGFNKTEQSNGGNIILKTEVTSQDKQQNKYADQTTLEKNGYVPFNGVFTEKENPVYLSKNISFYAQWGIWPNIINLDQNTFVDIWRVNFKNIWTMNTRDQSIPSGNTQLKFVFTDKLVTHNTNLLKDRESLRTQLVDSVANDAKNLADYAIRIYGNNPTNVSISTIDSFISQYQIYSSLFSSINIVGTIGMSIFVPLIVIMILVMTSIMMNEFKNMIAVLKTLGYSDRENILSIVFTYFPVMILAFLIGFALMIAMIYVLQFALYGLSSIYISSAISWLPYIYGVASIVGIMIINFVFTVVLLKKMNLKKVINQ